MEILKIIQKSITKIEDKRFNYQDITNTLKACKASIESITDSNKTHLLTLSELEDNLNITQKENKSLQKKLKLSTSHNEFLEPLFKKFKEQSKARLEFLNLNPQTKEDIVLKIDKAEYSDSIMELLLNIELKTKETLDSDPKQTKLTKLKIINNRKLKNCKSGV